MEEQSNMQNSTDGKDIEERNTVEGKRPHKFFDRFTIPGALVLMIGGLSIGQLIGMVIGFPLGFLIKDSNAAGAIGIVIATFPMLALYKFWFRPEFEGNLRGGDMKTGLMLSLILIPYWLLNVPAGFIFGSAKFGAPTLATVSMALMAGCSEEAAFRGLGISYLMRQWKEEKRIPAIVIISSVTFGLVHIFNALAGGDLGSVVNQTIGAAAMGFFFGALYLRSGNLIMPMVTHAIHDIIAFLDVSGIQGGVIVSGIDWTSYLDTGLTIVLGLIGLWLVRPAKQAEIRAMWDKKWNIQR